MPKSRSRSRSPRHRTEDPQSSRRRRSSRSRSPERRKHRHRRSKERKRSPSSDSSATRRRKKEKRKERKREKKRNAEVEWGKYGIISDIDIFSKTQEFHTWLLEERKINPETITKDQQRKEFSRFVEDYNTATLPHEKYYNMDAYDRRMAAMREGDLLPPDPNAYDFNADMNAVRSAHRKKPVHQEFTREQLEELRQVQKERDEIGRRKLLGMEIRQNFGVRMDERQVEDEGEG